jgi:hypothetical protein
VIGQIRNSVYTKFLSGLLALYLLNISVDTADPNPVHIPQDLSINDQESIVELIVEKVLGYENAIEECDDRDREDHNEKKNTKIDFLVYHYRDSKNSHLLLSEKESRFDHHRAFLTLDFPDIDTPPPKC